MTQVCCSTFFKIYLRTKIDTISHVFCFVLIYTELVANFKKLLPDKLLGIVVKIVLKS